MVNNFLSSEKMFDCQFTCREPWLLRLRLLERREQRSDTEKLENQDINPVKNFLKVTQKILIFPFLQVIAAEGEQKASNALKQAAEVIQQSPHALQVRREIFENQWGNIFDISAPVSADPELDICRAQLNHHIPHADDLTELGLNISKSLPSSIK